MSRVAGAPLLARTGRTRRLVTGVAIVAACLGMAWLQLWRAETRGALFREQMDHAQATPIALDQFDSERASALFWRPVAAQGVWLGEHTLLLDNKIHRSRVGYQVVTPLRLADSRVVLVNRGWVAAPRLRSELPHIAANGGMVRVEGIARPFPARVFEFGRNPPVGPVWQNLRQDEYQQHSGLDVLPLIVLQTSVAPDGLLREWSEVGGAVNPALRHYGYAAMWTVFALMAAGYAILAWRRPPACAPSRQNRLS